MTEQKTYAMLRGNLITYTGKVGSGLLTYSKELMVDCLKSGLRVAYITSAKNLPSIMEAVPSIPSDIAHGLTLYPINEHTLKYHPEGYPDGYLEDSVHQINAENYDVIMINSIHLLSTIEKDLIFKQKNNVVMYVFEQEALFSDTPEEILINLDHTIRTHSLKIIHLEKRTGYDFKTVKDREL